MNDLLSVLFKKHKLWLNYIKSFGCSNDTAEDFVQEMYIKIFIYVEKNGNDIMYNDTEVNYFFVYVTLKNMFYDNLRKKKKFLLSDLTNDIAEEEIEYTEVDFYLKNDAVVAWRDSLEVEINKIEEYTREKANLCYIRFIYEKILVERIPVSKLSRDVGITYFSLRNTVLIIKQQIKDLKK